MRTHLSLIGIGAALCCLTACGDGGDTSYRARPAPVVEGVYDATVDFGNRSIESVGNVLPHATDTSIDVQLGNDASVTFTGPVAGDGTLGGSGGLFVGDVGYQTTGEATFDERNGIVTVVGSTAATPTAPDGFSAPIAFTLRRPSNADAGPFSGAYRFTLSPSPSGCSCTSTIDLALTFESTGFGQAPATTEYDLMGTPLTSLTGAGGSLSPAGSLRIGANFPGPDGFGSVVVLIGTLTSSGDVATASGDTFAGFFSPAMHLGTWTAERID